MISLDHTIRLNPGVRLQQDTVRSRWVLLAPERMLELDEIAQLILERSQTSNIASLCSALATEFNAPQSQIEQDVLSLLNTLADKGFIIHD